MTSPAIVHRLLRQVQKPARYAGGELNSIAKDWTRIRATVALAYPDIYEIGMSNLGLAILYDIVNKRPDYAAERVYAPWVDMEAAMRQADVPLYSLETRHALFDFDVIGFTLQHELTYSNLLNMLDLGHIPILAQDRDEKAPLVIAGGSCAYNPEPMADFIDAFAIGEGEALILDILDVVAAWKEQGGREQEGGRHNLSLRLARIPGVYVPALYKASYNADNTLAAFEPIVQGAPRRIKKQILPTLGPAITHPIVPNFQTIHDRASIEIQRGCSRGCRFCQAGMIYRPIRERPIKEVLQAIDETMATTGYDEVGLVSLSSSDHSQIREIVAEALERHEEDGLSISLPSLRIDSFSVELAKMIQTRRKTGFTFAPEAGSQRLRDVINKGVTEEDLLRTAKAAFENGWNRIKLYFMLGLPTETDEDVTEALRLIQDILRMGRDLRGRRMEISVSASTFVPKPHTPFQWQPLAQREDVQRRQGILGGGSRSRAIRLSYTDWDNTWLEAIFSAEGLDDTFYTTRERSRDELLPWGHIDIGVTQHFLWSEYERALTGELSSDCSQDCHHCGIMGAFASERAHIEQTAWGCP